MAYRTPSQVLGSRCLADVPDSYYAEECPCAEARSQDCHQHPTDPDDL